MLVLVLSVSAALAVDEDWRPNWKIISFPNSTDEVYVAEDGGPAPPGLRVIWVYMVHEHPMPAQYFRQQKFAAEIQEWWVNCKEANASIATIRYTNDTNPNEVKSHVLVHPFGINDPAQEDVEIVCKSLTLPAAPADADASMPSQLNLIVTHK